VFIHNHSSLHWRIAASLIIPQVYIIIPSLRLDKDVVQDPPPFRHARNILLVRVDLVPGKLTAARVEVDLRELEPTTALPEETGDPEEDDDW
jgi:hypothetical protein